MRIRIDDNCVYRAWVSSESEGEKEYIVDLCTYPRGLDPHGNQVFNGSCGFGPESIHGCEDFHYRCRKKLKGSENAGKVYRCKHIRAFRECALDFILPYAQRADPNQGQMEAP